MPSSFLPLNSFNNLQEVKPNFSDILSFNEIKKTNFPKFVSKRPYSKFGCAQIARFAGSVHGVVVQIMNLASFGTMPFPSFTLKATYIV